MKLDKHKQLFSPQEQQHIKAGHLSPAIAMKLVDRFTLTPLTVSETGRGPTVRTPTAYSLAYYNNEPVFVQSTFVDDGNTRHLRYQNNAIIPGHSGSLVFDVSDGRTALLGFIAGVDSKTPTARVVPFDVLLGGVRAIRTNDLSATPLNLVCNIPAYINGAPMWLTPSAADLQTTALPKLFPDDTKRNTGAAAR